MTHSEGLFGIRDTCCLWSFGSFLDNQGISNQLITFSFYQFSSITESCPTLCNHMDWSRPGFPVHHQLLELAQTHDHRVGDAIQTSHPLLSHSPPAFNLSQHQGLFQWVSCLHQVAKILELQFQHQSLQWVFRIIFLFFLGLTGLTSMLSGGLSRVFFGTTIQKHQFFSVQPSLWSKSHIPSMGIPDHLTYLLRNL